MSGLEDRLEGVRLVRDSAGGIAPRPGAAGGNLRRIRALRFTTAGFDREVWREMCTLGWPGLILPEERGGSGLGLREFCALAEELGAALAPEPLIPGAMAAASLRDDRLAAVLAGDLVVVPAWQERANTLDQAGDTVLRDGRVTGRKMFVPMAGGADAFLVTTSAGPVLVMRDAPGVTLVVEQTQDGGNFGVLSFADAPGDVSGTWHSGALDAATLASAAYLLGVMEAAFALTLDYLLTRKQFGRVIGSFQALQHRAADLKLRIALTRASVENAADVFDGAPTMAERQGAVSRAKARASEAAMSVTQEAIQLHGGIGYTDEYDVGLYLRKAMVLSNLYGSPALHRRRFAACVPDGNDD